MAIDGNLYGTITVGAIPEASNSSTITLNPRTVVRWQSSDTKIFTCVEFGLSTLLTFTGPGIAYLTCTIDGVISPPTTVTVIDDKKPATIVLTYDQ